MQATYQLFAWITFIPLTEYVLKDLFTLTKARYQVVDSYFVKGCQKNVHATIPKGNMGYDQYTVPDTTTAEPTFVAFL